MWSWHPGTLTLTLTATRAISPGEEITIPYLDADSLLFDRQTRLSLIHSHHGFTCLCPFCASPDRNTIARSDAHRRELMGFWESVPTFQEWASSSQAHSSSSSKNMKDSLLIEAHHRALSLLAAESLLHHPSHRKHVDAIAMCYGALANTAEFVKWTMRAKELRVKEGDGCGEEEKGLDGRMVLDVWLEDPKLFPIWGCRVNGNGNRKARDGKRI
jgi:hypothetical protein